MPTDNSHLDTKIDIRRQVLQSIPHPRVFDAFSGSGEMHRAVWHLADHYIGCDIRPWSPTELPPRFVADNRLVLRCIDLQTFNIFDLDAYSSPADQLDIIANLRRWAPHEPGAIIITHCSFRASRSTHLRSINTPPALARAHKTRYQISPRLLQLWASKSNVAITNSFNASFSPSSLLIEYAAITFSGLPTPQTHTSTPAPDSTPPTHDSTPPTHGHYSE